MKNFVRATAISLLIVAVFGLSIPSLQHSMVIAGTNQPQNKGKKVKDVKVKTGPEVAQRVKQLKQYNKQVRNALKSFEDSGQKNGHMPKIEESSAITGTVSFSDVAQAKDCKSCGLFRKAGFTSQDTLADNGVEIIFVPTYSVPSEWQGTIIFNRYDGYGNLAEQYVADVVVTRPDLNVNSWNGIYEVSFEGDTAWLESDPALGMIDDPYFVLGTPLVEQPNRDMYQLDMLMMAKFNGVRSMQIGFRSAPRLVKANLQGPVPQPRPTPTPRPPGQGHPRVRKWAGCFGGWCGGSVVTCGVGSLIFAEITFGPCAFVGCGIAGFGCLWGSVFGA
ncbi:MAG: hypothetical protein ABR577_15805 [Pyrinomonadaceae bacterium]